MLYDIVAKGHSLGIINTQIFIALFVQDRPKRDKGLLVLFAPVRPPT